MRAGLSEMYVAVRGYNKKPENSAINQFIDNKKYDIASVKDHIDLTKYYTPWYMDVGDRGKKLIDDVRMCAAE